jgi:hypothetical protein
MVTSFTSATAASRRRLVGGFALGLAGVLLAPTFAASSATWDRLAQCESGQRWDANTGNGYYGGLQFSAATWLAYGGAAYAPKAHRATRAQQIAVAERLLADRGWGPWPACAAKLGLTSADAAPGPAVVAPAPTAPTADAAALLAARERKATNTAARLARKQADYDHAIYRVEKAIRHARTAPAAQQAARAAKIARLTTKADAAAAILAEAKAAADRAARKLRAAQAAAGVG